MTILFVTLSLITLLIASPQAIAQNPDLGKINFPNSGSEEAQGAFIKGTLLLHSFEYEDAAEEFKKAQKIDPEFALAYWGEVMTYNHPLWAQQDYHKSNTVLNKLSPDPEKRITFAKTEVEKGFIRAANALYGEGTKFERDFIYRDVMKELYTKFPNHNEVTSFYSLSIIGTSHNGRNLDIYKEAAEIAEKVFARNKNHPGALHYLIHAYDDPISAHLGLEAADLFAKVAPAASHALHMPSHIYVAKGMWDKVVSSNEASADAAEKRRLRKKLNLQARGYHALWWLHYGYLQQGRVKAALKLLKSMEQDTKKEETARTKFHLTSMRAAFLVETNQWQHEVGDIKIRSSTMNIRLATTDQFILGMKSVRNGDINIAKNALIEIGKIIKYKSNDKLDRNLTQCLRDKINKVRELPPPHVIAAMVMEKELEAIILFEEDGKDEALMIMELATEGEDNMAFMFGPPVIVKPSHELYGEMLLAANLPKKAREQFEKALERAPNRTLSLIGLARSAHQSNDEKTVQQTKEIIHKILAQADTKIAILED